MYGDFSGVQWQLTQQYLIESVNTDIWTHGPSKSISSLTEQHSCYLQTTKVSSYIKLRILYHIWIDFSHCMTSLLKLEITV